MNNEQFPKTESNKAEQLERLGKRASAEARTLFAKLRASPAVRAAIVGTMALTFLSSFKSEDAHAENAVVDETNIEASSQEKPATTPDTLDPEATLEALRNAVATEVPPVEPDSNENSSEVEEEPEPTESEPSTAETSESAPESEPSSEQVKPDESIESRKDTSQSERSNEIPASAETKTVKHNPEDILQSSDESASESESSPEQPPVDYEAVSAMNTEALDIVNDLNVFQKNKLVNEARDSYDAIMAFAEHDDPSVLDGASDAMKSLLQTYKTHLDNFKQSNPATHEQALHDIKDMLQIINSENKTNIASALEDWAHRA